MSLQACADIVARGDPDRFMATLAAPLDARRVLFPIYAFNVEVARAPWVTSEPMIGEMRLQWWRDVADEIATQRCVRKHEVASELAKVVEPDLAMRLDTLIAARRWDLYSAPFEDIGHFRSYLENTGGALMWLGAKSLGAADEYEAPIAAFGAATALVRFLSAVAELEARGRIPLVDGRPEAIGKLATSAKGDLPNWRSLLSGLPKVVRPALLEGWQTHKLLKQIANEPHRVAAGDVGQSAFGKKLSLLSKSLLL